MGRHLSSLWFRFSSLKFHFLKKKNFSFEIGEKVICTQTPFLGKQPTFQSLFKSSEPSPLTPVYHWLNHQSKLGKDLIPDGIWDWQDLRSFGANASRRGKKDWKEKGKRGVKAESLILAADGMTSAGGRGWLSLFGFKGRRKISPETQFRKS